MRGLHLQYSPLVLASASRPYRLDLPVESLSGPPTRELGLLRVQAAEGAQLRRDLELLRAQSQAELADLQVPAFLPAHGTDARAVSHCGWVDLE